MDREKVFDAFRNCITEPKCKNCPWEQCEQFNQKKVTIPVTLALDVLNLLKEQDELLKHEYWRGYNNGRADERGLQEGAIMQTFSPD